jgi:hypothetical protein
MDIPDGVRPIKIGYTGESVKKRMRTLCTGSPYKLKLRAAIPGTIAEEQLLHQLYQFSRLRGEWFTPSDRLEKLIEFAVNNPEKVAFAVRKALRDGQARPKLRRTEHFTPVEETAIENTIQKAESEHPMARFKSPIRLERSSRLALKCESCGWVKVGVLGGLCKKCRNKLT